MKKRVIYFDILKALAIIFVIFIHVISEYWESLNTASIEFLVLTLFDSISRFCVPIYFMISGALFLRDDKVVTIKDVFKKYIPKMLLIFVFWNLLYNFVDLGVEGKITSVSVVLNVIRDTILGKGIMHLYFLPIMIGFYLCVPILTNFFRYSQEDISTRKARPCWPRNRGRIRIFRGFTSMSPASCTPARQRRHCAR